MKESQPIDIPKQSRLVLGAGTNKQPMVSQSFVNIETLRSQQMILEEDAGDDGEHSEGYQPPEQRKMKQRGRPKLTSGASKHFQRIPETETLLARSTSHGNLGMLETERVNHLISKSTFREAIRRWNAARDVLAKRLWALGLTIMVLLLIVLPIVMLLFAPVECEFLPGTNIFHDSLKIRFGIGVRVYNPNSKEISIDSVQVTLGIGLSETLEKDIVDVGTLSFRRKFPKVPANGNSEEFFDVEYNLANNPRRDAIRDVMHNGEEVVFHFSGMLEYTVQGFQKQASLLYNQTHIHHQ